MTTQMLWIIFAVFVVGLFIGTNLGIMIMCILRMAAREYPVHDTVIPIGVQS